MSLDLKALAAVLRSLSREERAELLKLVAVDEDTAELELPPGTVLEPRGWPEPAPLPPDYWESAE